MNETTVGRTRRRPAAFFAALGLVASVVLVLFVAQAAAVTPAAAPTWPIPLDAPAAPPPIADLAAATGTPPPTNEITDPITPGAVCGDWYLQSRYGDRWPTASVWWEYRCQYEDPICEGACNANWSPSVWIDYFYWDGTQAAFYGEFFGDYYWASLLGSELCDYWWDAPTDRWYAFQQPGCPPFGNAAPTAAFDAECSALSCSFDATASIDVDGTIASYAWDFGDGNVTSGSSAGAVHSYGVSGSYTVTLIVTDDTGATATTSRAVTVTTAAPIAAFVVSCSGLSCSFDGSDSSDTDGTLVTYSWDFGDGTSADAELAQHTYAQAGTFTVALTVADDAGATTRVAATALVIELTAAARKAKGLQKVDLSWNGLSGQLFDIYRNGSLIATLVGVGYTDDVNARGPGTYTYKVCAQALNSCSDEARVSF